MDKDDTVRLPRVSVSAPTPNPTPAPPPIPRRGLLGFWAGMGMGAALVAASGTAWWWSHHSNSRAPALPRTGSKPQPASAPPVPPPAAPPTLSTTEILANKAVEPVVVRWAANPLVWLLDFPSLEEQGRAMNRMAALIEKASTPRDRVLDDGTLAHAIAADGRTAATWYFGHNYRAADLSRFFEWAVRDSVTLNPLEIWVREQVELARRVNRSRDTAFLSVPASGPQLDPDMRAIILRHELAHGQFFTLPFFAAHVMRVWEQGFSAAERTAFRSFLGEEGYDTEQEEVMANEAMAYLLYTPDARFFDPARHLGWSNEQASRIRKLLRRGAPEEP